MRRRAFQSNGGQLLSGLHQPGVTQVTSRPKKSSVLCAFMKSERIRKQLLLLFVGLQSALWAQPDLAQSTAALSPVVETGATAAAADTTASETFFIGLEFRPRTEFRNGYRLLRSDSSSAAFFTENRTRLNLSYQRKGFRFHTSIQDIRVWGEQDPRGTSGTFQVFEGYVEPSLGSDWSMRIGRQRVMYDNQRLFAQNDWRQNAGSHDGVRIMLNKTRYQLEAFGAFNQEAGAQTRFFGTDFSPDFDQYKALLVHYGHFKLSETFTLTMLHGTDVFQDKDSVRVSHWRHTSGGRAEAFHNKWYATIAGYYQYGRNDRGTVLAAWYVQPELSTAVGKNWKFRLGAEVFSGNNGLNPDSRDHAFDALYGVNHRFLGSMDYFTNFPGDLNGAGILAPYLFTFFEAGSKVTLRADAHLFYSQNHFVPEGASVAQDKYLGFENDWLLRYRPNNFTMLDVGYSYGLFTESMEQIRKGGNSQLWQSWAYVMVTFTPELFCWNKGPKT